MASERAFRDGETIPGTRYRVVGLVGRGGMGCVYEVEHLELGKHFVLKALLRELTSRADVASRLRNEWRALGRLEHPNIVAVTDAGTTSTEVPYYVMERLEGETLSRRLRRERRLHWSLAIPIAADVLGALAAAHRIGIVHRDIKPSNIYLVGDASAKLLDFGIAKIAASSAALTAKGVALGTPRYMSPEQARGEPVDGRADLYAVGLVLYEMLAGRGPFDPVRDANDLLLGHLARNPDPLGDLVPELPQEIERAVMWLLAKQPERRPAGAEQVRSLLLGFAMPGVAVDPGGADPEEDPDAPTRMMRTAPIEGRSGALAFAPTESRADAPRTEPLVPPAPALLGPLGTVRDGAFAQLGPLGTVRDAVAPHAPPEPTPRGKGQTQRLTHVEEVAATRTSVPVARPVVVTSSPVSGRGARSTTTLRRDLALAALAMVTVVVVGLAAVGVWSWVSPDAPSDRDTAVPVEGPRPPELAANSPASRPASRDAVPRASGRVGKPARAASAPPSAGSARMTATAPGGVPSASSAPDRSIVVGSAPSRKGVLLPGSGLD